MGQCTTTGSHPKVCAGHESKSFKRLKREKPSLKFNHKFTLQKWWANWIKSMC